MTTWRNPTDRPQRVRLFDRDNSELLIEIPPGETRSIPSEFDRAIQTTDCHAVHCTLGGEGCGHNGTIVGGIAPLLERVDENVVPPLH